MSKNEEKTDAQQSTPEQAAEQARTAEQAQAAEPEAAAQAEAEPQPEPEKLSELDQAKEDLAKEHENYLRLAAEYDNYRKRTLKEREALYTDIKAETAEKFLPVYDNLERALAQQTADEAYKKGVEMTMNQLVGVMEKLGVTGYGAPGETFDPKLHNAVMHVEDESLEANVIAEVFQKGFRLGEKVIRFAMVKVAN